MLGIFVGVLVPDASSNELASSVIGLGYSCLLCFLMIMPADEIGAIDEMDLQGRQAAHSLRWTASMSYWVVGSTISVFLLLWYGYRLFDAVWRLCQRTSNTPHPNQQPHTYAHVNGSGGVEMQAVGSSDDLSTDCHGYTRDLQSRSEANALTSTSLSYNDAHVSALLRPQRVVRSAAAKANNANRASYIRCTSPTNSTPTVYEDNEDEDESALSGANVQPAEPHGSVHNAEGTRDTTLATAAGKKPNHQLTSVELLQQSARATFRYSPRICVAISASLAFILLVTIKAVYYMRVYFSEGILRCLLSVSVDMTPGQSATHDNMAKV